MPAVCRKVANVSARVLAAAAIFVAPYAAFAGIESATYTPHTSYLKTVTWSGPLGLTPPKGWSGFEVAGDIVGSLVFGVTGLVLAAGADRKIKGWQAQKSLEA